MRVYKYLLIVTVIFLCLSTKSFAQSAAATNNEKSESEGSQKVLYTEEQQKLRITAKDIRLVPETDGSFGNGGGYHLYVRKLPNINSILLTETTKDPLGKNDNYAYRAKEYNPINGDEIRYLDGKPLVSASAKYSLVDSTPEPDEQFGQAFHIYIPEKIVFGYSWSRNGEIEIGTGTFINIRTFEKPYADYSGAFMDSPFMFNLEHRVKKTIVPKPKAPEPETPKTTPLPPIEEPEILEEPILTDIYNPVAHEKLKEISEEMTYSKGPETIVQDIKDVIAKNPRNDLDLVLAIDATGSMKNDIDQLKKNLMISLESTLKEFTSVRLGLLFYRDYGDTFKYKNLPVMFFDFTTNLDSFNKNLNSVKILGIEGGDIPEAVYEAIYASASFYQWRPDATKQIVLIGDAEPHPTPRGSKKYSRDYVMTVVESKNIKLETILIPDDQ